MHSYRYPPPKMMKVKRKRGTEAALSSWYDRESSLAEFSNSPPSDSHNEDLSIEWSSEEEKEQHALHKPSVKIQIPVKKISPVARRAETTDFESFGCQRDELVTQLNCTKVLRLDDTYNEQLKTPKSLKTKAGDRYTDCATSAQLISGEHSSLTKEKLTTEAIIHTKIQVDPLLMKNTDSDSDDIHITQVSNSQTDDVNEIDQNRYSDDDVTNKNDCTSPILGSRRIARKPVKVKPFPSLENFTFVSNMVAMRSELPDGQKNITDNTAVIQISPDVSKENDPVRSLVKRSYSFTFHPSMRKLIDIKEEGDEKEVVRDSFRALPHTKNSRTAETFDVLVNVDDTVSKDTSDSQRNLEGFLQRNQKGPVQNYKNTDKEVKSTRKVQVTKKYSEFHPSITALKESLQQKHEDSHLEDHHIDDTLSQIQPSKIEDNESQEECYIDILATPTKPSQPGSTNASLDGNNPSISSESTPSSVTVTEDPNSCLKSGFNWVKCLQQQTTPQKPSAGDIEEAAESAKKKHLKDGEAARLHRLIVSWQSCINTWMHQMSLSRFSMTNIPQKCSVSSEIHDNIQIVSTSLHKLKGNIKEESVDRPSHSLTHLSNCKARVMQEKADTLNGAGVLRSPAVRNLQDLLIESPASSPGVSSLTHIQIPVSKKYLELKVIKVESRYPSNSALCELISSSDETLQRTIKVEGTTDKNNYQSRRKYQVFFSLQEHKITTPLRLNDIAKVYPPWQTLNLPAHDVPVLFSSYFTLIRAPGQGKTQKQRIYTKILCTWNCTCSSDPRVLPSKCEAHKTTWTPVLPTKSPMNLLALQSTFNAIADSPKNLHSQEGSHTWTVLEGIERCGGVFEVPVSLTTRIHRSIPQRDSKREVEEWLLVCQDASGVFCIVRVPNKPLAHKFSSLLNGEVGGTHTLTHLTIVHRLTNTQNPGLFSLISSLHSAYQAAVCSDPLLPQLLSYPRPPQTSCYCFTVNLGSTSLLPCREEVVLPLSLPRWSLQQAFEVKNEGQRGSLSLHLLYVVDSFLYVMSHGRSLDREPCKDTQKITKENSGASDILATERDKDNSPEEVDANTSNNCSGYQDTPAMTTDYKDSKQTDVEENKNTVKRLVVTSKSSLPPWMPKEGTLMQQAQLRDVVVWRGNIMIDEYSSIHQEEEDKEEKKTMNLNTLLQVLCPLSHLTQQHDLTLLTGKVLNIDEDTAYTWPICPKCGSEELTCSDTEGLSMEGGEVHTTGVECSTCGTRSSTPAHGYSLQLWLSCRPLLEGAEVKVKLYQRTIEKLLAKCNRSTTEEHNVQNFQGVSIGPLVCVVRSLSRLKQSTSPLHYFLAELPY